MPTDLPVVQEASGSDVVGHKTLRRPDGSMYHEPLTRTEADALWKRVQEEDARRKTLMPDEQAAIGLFFDAWRRLKDFGWREAIYCPKDGSSFDVIEAGSTGIHPCFYSGEWPKGYWMVGDGLDVGPSRPVLFRPKAHHPDTAAEQGRGEGGL